MLLTAFRSLPLILSVVLFALHGLAHPNRHGHFGLDRATHRDALSKRWLTINPSENNQLWPDGIVKYRFDNDEAKAKLGPVLERAMNLWYCNGLPKKFKLEKVGRLYDATHKGKVLHISYNDKGIMSTSNGIPKTSTGPVSHLSTRSDIGMQDVDANVAHEIGHMFGLLHEHQDDKYWGTGLSDPVFRFNCENLRDYEEKTRGKTEEQINGDNGICKSREEAAKAEFSAAEYLPFRGNTRSPNSLAAGPENVDWESIMLYPSGAGGKPSKEASDDRAAVLLKREDNSLIQPNVKPSKQDVDALKNLYGIK